MFDDLFAVDLSAFWGAASEVVDYHGDMPADEYDQRRDLYAAVKLLQEAANVWDRRLKTENDYALAARYLLDAATEVQGDDTLKIDLLRLYHRFFRTCPAHGEYSEEHQTGWQYLTSDGEVSDNIEYHHLCRVCGEEIQPVAIPVAVEIDDEIPF